MKLTIQMMDGKSLPKVPGDQTIVSSSWDIGKLGPDERLDPSSTGLGPGLAVCYIICFGNENFPKSRGFVNRVA